jgi:ABC-type nitrate/sulfonate/bicarbonate transport system substrate-binding protein
VSKKQAIAAALFAIAAGIPPGLGALLGDSRFAVAADPNKALPVLTVTVFAAPSQVVWFPVLIQRTGLDTKHGFKLEVKQKPPQVAYADFAAGADPVCYCASTGAVGRFVQQGADVTLLWNIFDYDYFVVTGNPAVKKPKDLEGRTLLADTVTGSWAIANWLLQQQGVDFSKVQLRSASVRGAEGLAQLLAGRADGVVVTPIDASAVLADSTTTLRAFSVYDPQIWQKFARSPTLPSIAAAAWRNWAAKPANLDLLRRLYAANLEAAELVKNEPEKSAELIEQGTGITKKTLVHYFAHFGHLIDIRPISEDRESIAALTEKILPDAKQLDRPMTPKELDVYVSDFQPK